MNKEQPVVEFIAADDFEDRMSDTSKHIDAESGKVVRLPRSVSRKEVAQNFGEAFEQIGGVLRLAQWADECPTDFYRLYSRLLPSQASSALGESNEIVIRHVLPRSALDE